MKGILQSRSPRPFVPPEGLFAGFGLAPHQDAPNWLAAVAAVDEAQLAWQRNERECYENAFGEAIDVYFIREALLAEVPKAAAVYSEVSSEIDELIKAELVKCGGKKSGIVSALKSDVVHLVEAAVERQAEKSSHSSAKSPVAFVAKKAPGMGALTAAHQDHIQMQLNKLRALKDRAHDEWLAAMAENGMRYTDDGLQITLEGDDLPNGSKPFATVPLSSIRFYHVKKVMKDGVEMYEIVMQTPVFAGGVWSMSEVREEFSAASKWVQDHLGATADAIAKGLMSREQSTVLDVLKLAQAQAQQEISEAAKALAQATPKLDCGEACASTLGALSSYVPSVNSRAFPKLPSAPSLMV